MRELETLVQRSYITYKARINASNRLASRNLSWNVSLVSLSTALVIAAVGLLENKQMYGSRGPTLLASLAILSLSISLVVTGLNYGGRSRDLFASYRRIQRLSSDAEGLLARGKVREEEVKILCDRYQSLLDESENHSTADYFKAEKEANSKISDSFNSTLNPDKSGWRPNLAALGVKMLAAIPFLFLLLPFSVLCPFIAWVINGK